MDAKKIFRLLNTISLITICLLLWAYTPSIETSKRGNEEFRCQLNDTLMIDIKFEDDKLKKIVLHNSKSKVSDHILFRSYSNPDNTVSSIYKTIDGKAHGLMRIYNGGVLSQTMQINMGKWDGIFKIYNYKRTTVFEGLYKNDSLIQTIIDNTNNDDHDIDP